MQNRAKIVDGESMERDIKNEKTARRERTAGRTSEQTRHAVPLSSVITLESKSDAH